MWREHVLEIRLVEEDRANLTCRVTEKQLEDLKAAAPSPMHSAAEHFAGYRRGFACRQFTDGSQSLPVLVPNRKTEEEIFEHVQSGIGECRRTSWSDALDELEWSAEPFGHCTTTAWPASTITSRMLYGNSNGADRSKPCGYASPRV